MTFQEPIACMSRFVIYADQGAQIALGAKAAALARLQPYSLAIPTWFVVTADAFYASLSDQQRCALQAAEGAEALLDILHDLYPSDVVMQDVSLAMQELGFEHALVAVRSSAFEEDGQQHSFAGQFDSFLMVEPEQIRERIAAVWRSGFSERMLAYHHIHQLDGLPSVPAVLIQRMVHANISGVAFAIDPVTGQPNLAVVASVPGLGNALVSGDVDADTWYVDQHQTIIRPIFSSIAEKNPIHARLSDAQVLAIAALVRQVSDYAGCPQDIEWAMEDDQLFLLQARPITTLTHAAESNAVLNIWDNSNIAESYAGITTPLTFSFAHRAYAAVYCQFCRLMGVSEQKIADHQATFTAMIGLIRGRIYYNLLSWYRVLTLLPGFRFNQRFMEQMMGLREGVPAELVAGLRGQSRIERLRDGLDLLRTIGGLIANYLLLERKIQAFYQRLDQSFAMPAQILERMPAEQLVAHYRDLERRLLTHWDAPLINDFFCMIFFGLLRNMTTDQPGAVYNALLCEQGGMLSAEPARRLAELGRLAAADPDFVQLLTDGSYEQIMQTINGVNGFRRAFDDYVQHFGDRCLDELKLESPTLHDDALMLLRSAGHYARHLQAAQCQKSDLDASQSHAAPQHSAPPIKGKGFLFGWVLTNARRRVRDRENLRFERTRVFGRVRRIFVALGQHLSTLHILNDPRDIFFLNVDEVLGFIEGTSTTCDLKGLVALRQAEFASYTSQPAPARRFYTRGIVHYGNNFVDGSASESHADMQLQGIACCPGIVRGPARIISNPRQARLEPGDILVAERTDPGWIMLFPCAAGILVERGSVLSHAAIVAREIRIPTIVALPGLTQWLRDGDMVELDGSTGMVRRIPQDSSNQM